MGAGAPARRTEPPDFLWTLGLACRGPCGCRHRRTGREGTEPGVPQPKERTSMKRFWIVLAFVVTFGFTVLGWIGSRIYQAMPPIPERLVTSDGQVVAPEGSIRSGQSPPSSSGPPGRQLPLAPEPLSPTRAT